MTPFDEHALPCDGGPLSGKRLLPGDDVPEAGTVTLTDREPHPNRETIAVARRGYYERTGDRFVWRRA